MKGLDGRSAVVIGGATGIGAATARRLAAEGASVVIGDINMPAADALAADIRAGGGVASAFEADISEATQVEAVMAAAAKYGGIDVLHNNAVSHDSVLAEQDSAVADVDLEIWDKTIAVNLTGYMLGCRFALPYMLEAGRGAIVNTSSVVSYQPSQVQPSYVASKGGINALTLSVAATYGKRGIRCNAVCPGFIETEQLVARRSAEFRDSILKFVPSSRLGRPADIAAMVAFLASDDAEFINGQIITVDGGMTVPNPTWVLRSGAK